MLNQRLEHLQNGCVIVFERNSPITTKGFVPDIGEWYACTKMILNDNNSVHVHMRAVH